MTDREKVIKALECRLDINGSKYKYCLTCDYRHDIDHCQWACQTDGILEDALALLKAQEPITGETSDGYHTFNELYHHRAVLFSVIVNNYKDLAWKSVRHHDGTMYDGMFIVGIDTPDGQATYHYDINPYWDMFMCRVREFAPEWDGHTPAQAIERIGKLKAQEPRVMTLEEIKALPDYVFLEDRDISHAFSIKTISRPALPQLIFVNTNNEECVGFKGPDGDTSLATSRYGVEWRCWTSRPTDEQREAVKWE